ncbi:MAG TPA: Ig-like domain-containing protein, partial [Terriglobales bacterium]|nr:Ig-like domain-containing protein [Terriglobales bacterium]
MTSKSHSFLLVSFLASLILTVACGGGGSTAPAPPPPPNAVTGVTVTPNAVTLNAGETQQFAATVSGTGTFTTVVTWSANGVAGGNATQGTISSTGLYTAPNPSPGPVTITATSTFNTTKSGAAQVTVNNPLPPANAVTSVTVTPNPTTLTPGQAQQFAATVSGTGTFTNGVTWTVNGVPGGNAKLGTITSSGFY